MNWVAVKLPVVLVTLFVLTSVTALAKEGNFDTNTRTTARVTIEKPPSSKLPTGNHRHRPQEISKEKRNRSKATMTITTQGSEVNGSKDRGEYDATSIGGKEYQWNRSWRRRRGRMEDSEEYNDRVERQDSTSPALSEKGATTAKPRIERWKVYSAAAVVAVVMLVIGYKKKKDVRRLIFGYENVDKDDAIDLPPEQEEEGYLQEEAGAVGKVAQKENKKTNKKKDKKADKKAEKKSVDKKKPGSPKHK